MLLRLFKHLWRRGKTAGPGIDQALAQTEQERARRSLNEGLQRGLNLEKAGRLAAALDCYRACAATHPGALQPRLAVANALSALWRTDECIATLTGAVELAPRGEEAWSQFLVFNHFATRPDPPALFAAHRRYGEILSCDMHGRHARNGGHFRNIAERERPLRIGYVSANFSRHSVGYFIEPVIARHDRTRYEVYCYYTHPYSDETTERIARLARWRHVAADDDDALAERISEDGIDVLVDLGGHTQWNRLRVFARRAAPVQMTWLGYPDTTGLAAIDHRITDAIADPPPHADALHTERLLRLAPPFLCYQPPADSPPVAQRESQAQVVFASFNLLIKVNERSLGLWARILDAVPHSRIVLKSNMLEHEETVCSVRERFAARGIDPARVDLRSWAQGRAQHLGTYDEIDIALDTFPYNGTTTTCEALWMGVPVVTLAGDVHMSRVGATLLAAAGLQDLIATDEDEYVRKAIALARDAGRRQALRREMRKRLAASPLLDHQGFVNRLEHGLRDAWMTWCEARSTSARADVRRTRPEDVSQ